MKQQIKRLILAAAVVLGVSATLCLIFAGLLWWGLCYGVDPMSQGIQAKKVSAMRATQRLGDQRLYIFVENHNDCEVAADIGIDLFNKRTNKLGTKQIHKVLGPHSNERIYPTDPNEEYGEVLSLSVTKHNRRRLKHNYV